jgi:BlaI family transcriptional regulator, penicillinase repressor
MKGKKAPVPNMEPTKSELEILQVLWASGPSTARFINDHLNKEKREVGYMSTLKLMQIMVEKKFLEKDESKMTHVYTAVIAESTTKALLLDKVVDTVFNGSAGKLVMQLIGNTKLTTREKQDFEELIKKIDKR